MRFPASEPSIPEPVPLEGSPFSHYYAQDSSDEGIMMETDVPVKEVSVLSQFIVQQNRKLLFILLHFLHKSHLFFLLHTYLTWWHTK